MDRAEAARILGVSLDAGPGTVRDAFRALIRQHHPDRAGDDGGDVAALLIEAHRVLRDPGPPVSDPSPPATPATPATPVDARAEGDALFVRADPDTVMARLVEAAHQLGEVTYLDRGAGLVEVLVLVEDGDGARPAACSLVASLQGRLDSVEVFCTVERLDGHPAPPVAPLVAALAGLLQRG